MSRRSHDLQAKARLRAALYKQGHDQIEANRAAYRDSLRAEQAAADDVVENKDAPGHFYSVSRVLRDTI